MSGVLLTAAFLTALAAQPQLRIELVGNAGVVLSDGRHALLVDLPYASGAFGYMTYAPERLRPDGNVIAVITHHHRDHFDRQLFLSRESWRIIGPPSVVGGLPPGRVLTGDSLTIGDLPSSPYRPHTPKTTGPTACAGTAASSSSRAIPSPLPPSRRSPAPISSSSRPG